MNGIGGMRVATYAEGGVLHSTQNAFCLKERKKCSVKNVKTYRALLLSGWLQDVLSCLHD